MQAMVSSKLDVSKNRRAVPFLESLGNPLTALGDAFPFVLANFKYVQEKGPDVLHLIFIWLQGKKIYYAYNR